MLAMASPLPSASWLFQCFLAIFVCLAGLGDARHPLETQEQPFSGTVQVEQSGSDVAEKQEFGDPNSYDHVLRLPSEKDDSITNENPQMQPDNVFPKWEPRFPVPRHPFVVPFDRELGRSRLEERGLTFRRFPFGGRWPFRFGRPGGCDHSKRMHFLMRRGDFGRRHFPGSRGPDSIRLHIDFDGETGAFKIFPNQREPVKFLPEVSRFEHSFQPADLGELKPYDSPVFKEVVPNEHVHRVFPGEAALRFPEERDEGPPARWMGWLKSLFHRP